MGHIRPAGHLWHWSVELYVCRWTDEAGSCCCPSAHTHLMEKRPGFRSGFLHHKFHASVLSKVAHCWSSQIKCLLEAHDLNIICLLWSWLAFYFYIHQRTEKSHFHHDSRFQLKVPEQSKDECYSPGQQLVLTANKNDLLKGSWDQSQNKM